MPKLETSYRSAVLVWLQCGSDIVIKQFFLGLVHIVCKDPMNSGQCLWKTDLAITLGFVPTDLLVCLNLTF